MKTTICMLTMGCVLFGCSHERTEPPAASTTSERSAGAEMAPEASVMAVKPDTDKLKNHLSEHIKYPATREQIIAACAQTDEFTAGEKKWIGDTLPEGTYNSSDDVMNAMHVMMSE